MLERLEKFKGTILKYGVAAILLVVPLYPKFPLFNIPGTYVAVRAEDFLIAALGIFWVIYFFRNGSRDFLKNPLNRAIVLFLGVGLLSLASAILLTKTVSFHLAVLHWGRRVEYMIPFFIAVLAMKTRKEANHIFFAESLFVALVVAFVYGLGQVYAGFPVISTQNEEFAKGIALRFVPGSRLYSTFAGHYDLSAFLVLVFPIIFAFLLASKNLLYRAFLLFGVAAPSFWLLLRTESRVSFFSYLLAVTVTLWLVRRKLFIIPFIITSTILMATIGGLGDRYLYTINIYKQKFIDRNILNWAPKMVWAQEEPVAAPTRLENKAAEGKIPNPVIEDRSTSIRFKVEWPRAIRAFAKNPLLGTGYSSIGLAADNDYLRLLGEVGLVGFLAFLLVLTRFFSELGRIFRKGLELDFDTAFAAGFIGGMAGLLLNATFIDVFEASKVAIIFWTLAGIAVGIVWRRVGHE